MAISASGDVKYMVTHIPGLYRWSGTVADTGDASGGSATLNIKMGDSADPAPKLWYYLTEIWYRMSVVTAQPGELTLDDADWPGLNPDGATQRIGVPAPIMDADTFGGTPADVAILRRPIWLGQPAGEADVFLTFLTTNTNTMTHSLMLRGFATQKPINPFPYLGGR